MEQNVDSKIIDRIRKLLALANDGGATEHEATLAMSKAQETMAEYNLSMAALERAGGKGDERRKDTTDKNLMYPWKRELLEAVAKVNFCYLNLRFKTTKARQCIGAGFDLIGRESNIIATRNMFEYLEQTIERLLVEEVGTSPQDRFTRWAHSFRLGAAQRLRERLEERHDQRLREQEQKAREANATARHPGAAPGTALVILKEYAGEEQDLNDDMRLGLKPGTTRANRLEREARYLNAMNKAKELLASDPTLDESVASYMSQGWSRDRAEQIFKVGKYAPPPETEAQRRRREEREDRENRRYWEREEARERREARKVDWRGFARGEDRGAQVGLDDQIDKQDRKSIR